MKRNKNERGHLTALQKRLADHLRSGKGALSEDSPLNELLQTTINAVLEGELTDHLSNNELEGVDNKRNGYQTKRVLSEHGMLDISTPRDRKSSFEPELVAKRQRVLNSGLNDQILALYAQGNSIEDVRRLIKKMFSVEISVGKISAITDEVLPLVEAWRGRPLLSCYATLYLDAVHFKVRREGKYASRAFYTVYAVDLQGHRDILGLYMTDNEGANNWGRVLENLQDRGVEDVLVICTDNLNGFSEAIGQAFPTAVVQKCIVHQVRNSMRFVSDKERKKMCADLRTVYTAANQIEARLSLDSLYVKWDKKYHRILDDWNSKWDELMAFMDFPEPMRKMIYTTNPVEAVHRVIRKLLKAKAAWTSETALFKQMYLSLMHNEKSWKRRARSWNSIMTELLKLYGPRIEKHLVN